MYLFETIVSAWTKNSSNYSRIRQFVQSQVLDAARVVSSLNPEGVFADTNPNVALYAPEELGPTASTPYTNPEQHTHLIAGTDSVDQLDAGEQWGDTHEEVRIWLWW